MADEVQTMANEVQEEPALEFRLSCPQRIINLFRLLMPGDQYDLLLELFDELSDRKQQEFAGEVANPAEIEPDDFEDEDDDI